MSYHLQHIRKHAQRKYTYRRNPNAYIQNSTHIIHIYIYIYIYIDIQPVYSMYLFISTGTCATGFSSQENRLPWRDHHRDSTVPHLVWCTHGWSLPCLLSYCSAGPWVAACGASPLPFLPVLFVFVLVRSVRSRLPPGPSPACSPWLLGLWPMLLR